jgi:hypothetical protein
VVVFVVLAVINDVVEVVEVFVDAEAIVSSLGVVVDHEIFSLSAAGDVDVVVVDAAVVVVEVDVVVVDVDVVVADPDVVVVTIDIVVVNVDVVVVDVVVAVVVVVGVVCSFLCFPSPGIQTSVVVGVVVLLSPPSGTVVV